MAGAALNNTQRNFQAFPMVTVWLPEICSWRLPFFLRSIAAFVYVVVQNRLPSISIEGSWILG